MDSVPPGTLAVISRTPSVLRSLLAGLSAEALAAVDEGGWTPKHVIAHLVDRQPVQRERIGRMISEERPFLPNAPEPESLEETGLMESPVTALLDAFAAARAEDMRVF